MRTILLAMIFATVVLFGKVLDASAAEKTYVIGFAQDNMANDWRAAQVHAVDLVQREVDRGPDAVLAEANLGTHQ